ARWPPLRPHQRSPTKRLPPLTPRRRPPPTRGVILFLGSPGHTPKPDPTPGGRRLRPLRPPRPALQRIPLLIGQHQLGHRPASTRHPPSIPLIIEFPAHDTRSLLN